MSHDEVGSSFELAMYRLQIAMEDLETAKSNYGQNHLRAANNRAYYSIYHSITAVLALEKIAFKRHKDTMGYFNRMYIKNKIFSWDLGHKIAVAEEIRHASDYDEFYIASKEETEKQILAAEELYNAVKEYVNNSAEK